MLVNGAADVTTSTTGTTLGLSDRNPNPFSRPFRSSGARSRSGMRKTAPVRIIGVGIVLGTRAYDIEPFSTADDANGQCRRRQRRKTRARRAAPVSNSGNAPVLTCARPATNGRVISKTKETRWPSLDRVIVDYRQRCLRASESGRHGNGNEADRNPTATASPRARVTPSAPPSSPTNQAVFQVRVPGTVPSGRDHLRGSFIVASTSLYRPWTDVAPAPFLLAPCGAARRRRWSARPRPSWPGAPSARSRPRPPPPRRR